MVTKYHFSFHCRAMFWSTILLWILYAKILYAEDALKSIWCEFVSFSKKQKRLRFIAERDACHPTSSFLKMHISLFVLDYQNAISTQPFKAKSCKRMPTWSFWKISIPFIIQKYVCNSLFLRNLIRQLTLIVYGTLFFT